MVLFISPQASVPSSCVRYGVRKKLIPVVTAKEMSDAITLIYICFPDDFSAIGLILSKLL